MKPKKNKYVIFSAIGFELVSLILVAIWAGNYLGERGYGDAAKAFCILAAFLVWFISLIIKLKSIKND
ncbi:hypothetical protein [Pseudobdellovibrio exovorus]|uniref:Uncharacterized protein n=1 Tax=Pseudobdellovibrio exovorus JSS TaxID=1184267 RepID=M4V4G9_9BACT|nr:hypothetical protein [Pseudobdellovibrio exovorus]AGH94227.1 hypothetical protein A11Q_7 [Pseudobdellovibrio exovorus JSS]